MVGFKNRGFFLCTLCILSVLCGLNCNKKNHSSYVILSFDDNSVDEWFENRELFLSYNIKATFFISHPQLLTDDQIDKLKILMADGHEIGCHGFNHKRVTDENMYQYIENEIIPALHFFSENGFTVSSFAYPFGNSVPYLDSLLTNYFTFIRKATYNYNDTLISSYPEIYAHPGQYCITNAMGIDSNYFISMENLEAAIIKAKETNTYLVLYAHEINESNEDYSITPKYLEELFVLMKKNNVQSMLCNELILK